MDGRVVCIGGFHDEGGELSIAIRLQGIFGVDCWDIPSTAYEFISSQYKLRYYHGFFTSYPLVYTGTSFTRYKECGIFCDSPSLVDFNDEYDGSRLLRYPSYPH